jgi:hypothetical protein
MFVMGVINCPLRSLRYICGMPERSDAKANSSLAAPAGPGAAVDVEPAAGTVVAAGDVGGTLELAADAGVAV